MKTLLLVDGSSYLYRAFHALPDLRNQQNEPTGAIHGVLNMLGRLQKDYPSDYIACIFDAKGKTFRECLYPAYKANRPPMPADLVAQIEPLHECIAALGWPILSIKGVEADDVIGTLAKQATVNNISCVISTGDKDIAQLVNAHVTLVNTMSREVLTETGVMTKFGVSATQILDYLALIGDTSDNIPGVDKVGPKTAVKWLTKYETLDNIIAHADEIKGVVGNNLRNALHLFALTRKLLTIKCDVALPLSITELRLKPRNTEKLITWFKRLDMQASLRELQRQSFVTQQTQPDTQLPENASPPIANNSVNYQTIWTESELDKWITLFANAPLVSIDTETTSLNPMQAQLVGISFCIAAHKAAYLPLAHNYPGVLQQIPIDIALKKLKPWLEDPSRPKLGQNIKYDKHIFANHGITLEGIMHDTLLQSYIIESHLPHNMDSLAIRHLGIKTMSYDDITGKGVKRIGFEQVEIEKATPYAAEDADITLQLHQNLYTKLTQNASFKYIYQQLEMPVLEVLFEMERNGVLLDKKLLASQSVELGEKILNLEQHAFTLAKQVFNLNSPKQIQQILFEKLKLPIIKKTPKGMPSTDEKVLQQLSNDYPLPKILLEHRSLSKLKSTYTSKLPIMVDADTGRVHTNYAQAIAVTGRLSSSDPNLQNIPIRTIEGRRVREAFIAPPGRYIISADYSQIELRIMAHISQDTGLLKAFAAGEDIHAVTAAEIFSTPLASIDKKQRRYAKTINFGLIYGMSEFGLATQLGVTRSAARSYMDRYFARYPGVATYMQRTRDSAKKMVMLKLYWGAGYGCQKLITATVTADRVRSALRLTPPCKALLLILSNWQ